AGYARLQKSYFFLPLPNGAYAVGEGAGGGAKATGHKGSFIAVWHPGARLNSYVLNLNSTKTDRLLTFLQNDYTMKLP
ncbi:MAG TPA: hypothetical protein P5211_06510, partial [Anaerolineae bacterium]|nr:hypothetical protein [Anaerolineae bacterium]